MKKADWPGASAGERLLDLRARKALRSNKGQRKFRLLACACAWCRRFLDGEGEGEERRILETCECHADGLADEAELLEARASATRILEWVSQDNTTGLGGGPDERFQHGLAVALIALVRADAVSAASAVVRSANYLPEPIRGRIIARELVAEVFGNPFQPVKIGRALLAPDGAVAQLARAIYDERAFADMPILADALEDAGCDNAELLAHFRGPNEHVRGCWALDLLLGRSP